jgi:hypothetical protein
LPAQFPSLRNNTETKRAIRLSKTGRFCCVI